MARVATAGSELSRPVPQPGPGTSQRARSAARLVAPLLQELFNGIPVRFSFWDGSIAGPDSTPGTVVFHSPDALKRLLWAPNELGLARTFVAGDVDIEGDFYEVLKRLRDRTATKRRPGLRGSKARSPPPPGWVPSAPRPGLRTRRCASRGGAIPRGGTRPPSATTTTSATSSTVSCSGRA